ncbi:hypothetical protein C8A05DRAFT_29357 [Staphylotrichum tortipilum]|uniref:HFB protein n=1 Tax=Staphylotrichum tortipilum TaxID=2831512 RepID=A0AAN6MU99_9PEZI|nr:hypothetical protein C8A05DRAFT_29357 [Staphylotrichum longicolle]
MRFTSILATAGFALLASAAGTATTVAPATSVDAASAAASSAQASILACLNACKAGEVGCTSKCIAVPNPNEAQVNATNTCVAACPQGNGSASETAKYSDCVQGCISANYFKPSSGTPQPTGSSNSGNSNSGSSGSNNNGGESASGTGGAKASGTATGTAASSSSSGAAAGIAGASGMVGMVGLVAAAWAL